MTHNIAAAQQLIEGTRSKRAIIFARARSLPPDPERESAQLEAQEQYCYQVAEGLKAEVVEVYAVRGGTTDPVTQRMVKQLLDEVEVGGIDYVILQNLDRLTRRPSELARIVRRLAAAGVRLVTTAAPAEAFLQDVSLFCLVAASDNKRRSA